MNTPVPERLPAPSTENLFHLDHAQPGFESLAANLFRLTQTEAKIRRENRRGQQSLEHAAEEVGRRVRQTMQDISGNRPEELPPASDIKAVRKKLKSAQRGFRKLDKAEPPKRITDGSDQDGRGSAPS